MIEDDKFAPVLDAIAERQRERRRFLKVAGGASAAIAGASLLAACGDDDDDDNISAPAPTPTPTSPTPSPTASEGDVLNFALNLEYLEAQFYSYAATGAGLPAALLSGTGTAGQVTGGQQVQFRDPLVRQYALEIAADERAHVAFLRRAIGNTAVAQPAIDISGSATGAFSAAARAAGLVGAGQAFDPYASDEAFLLGAYIFEDVGVTAYKRASILINTPAFLEAAAGILAAEAYHAGLVRTVLYQKGIAAPNAALNLIAASESISTARDSLDGADDRDQGIQAVGGAANLVPTDPNGIAFGRDAAQVLNIVYLNRASVSSGGFFPSGLNGTIRTSAAS
ncbi:ferritin-like domain-containing protein [Sphingomonas jejuensis]|nr:ferritin-like domain-containing protein [Sphingomonas jejuensis]